MGYNSSCAPIVHEPPDHAILENMKKSRTAATMAARNTRTGTFVLGRNAFARVSAVERIVPSAPLRTDLDSLHDASPEERRAMLTAKYGKS